MPAVDGQVGVRAESMDTEHIVFHLDEGVRLKLGDQVALIPGQQDAMVSRWDRFVGIRDGKVEIVWDIEARGCHS